jgi:hypothetical protein
MPLDKAISKGIICKICCAKATRNGICKSCSASFKSSKEVSIEAFIKLCLYHFFGDHIKSNFNLMIGGQSCKEALDGGDCEEKTKGAYIDIPIVLPDRLICGEVDENQHRYYQVACELARYDTLAYGATSLELVPTLENPFPTQGRATIVIRLNPHDTDSMKVPFIERVRVFIQMFRNLMTQPISANDRIGATVYYLFYGEGNVHQDAAQHAEMTIRIMPYINDPADVLLDEDISAFKLEDLVPEEISAATQAILIQRQIELSSSTNQCIAWNNAKNPALKHRCSSSTKKGVNLCSRHYKLQQEGRAVALE